MASNESSPNPVLSRAKAADERFAALSALLSRLDEAAQTDGLSRTATPDAHQSQLVSARLGIASSLFAALRAKHAPSAAHCLRVALGISSWAVTRNFRDEELDAMEIAALLHDVGKIGVPDHVMLNPGKLCGDDLLEMERHRHIGCEILNGCCTSKDILDIVLYSSAWFNGSKHGFDRKGHDLPQGSRMIAIVDAFDSMTTDHVYRPAMCRDRAVAELFEFSGTQFDPELVREYCELVGRDHSSSQSQVARRWLRNLSPDAANQIWGLRPTRLTEPQPSLEHEFHERLVDTMSDGVVFVDQQLRITRWNRATERLTGVLATSVIGRQWSPALLRLRDDRGRGIADVDCPVLHTLKSGVQSIQRYIAGARGDGKMSIDFQVTPVIGELGLPRGVTVVLHDASSQISLEERVQLLHERATRDPLTNCANRAELNRVLPEFMDTHLCEGRPCSMVICDIDHFKKINDTHGHQAGDAALTSFAALLLRSARSGDLVARYGGEEFVLLCADCGNATATRRAEEIRRRVCETPIPAIGNGYLSASFGVTEIQCGDTPESFLRRADRALLQAKDAGRNVVIQLGTGIDVNATTTFAARGGWLSWLGGVPGEILLRHSLVTVVPLNVSTEKLRGFVADHHSQIVSVEGNRVVLTIDAESTPLIRRTSDRAVPFVLELTFEETEFVPDGKPNSTALRTVIHVIIRPKRQRDRRRKDALERARQILASLKSYLMAQDHLDAQPRPDTNREQTGLLHKSKQILFYWLRK